MLSITHSVVGGALGAEIGQPFVAYLAGIIAHFIMDKIPHFWPKEKKGQTVVKSVDAFLTVGALVAMLLFYPEAKYIFWGALGGATVDAVLVLTPLETKSKVGLWHTRRQIHKESYLYYATDLLLIGIALTWLLVRG